MTPPFRLAIGLLAAVLGLPHAARAAVDDAPEAAVLTPEQEKERANELAKELANPVANLWSMTFQYNNFALTNDRWNYNLNFQPVMPLSLTKEWNLITRPVIQVYNSAPYTSSTGANARTTNFGDWTQLELLSPANSGHWLLGAGPTFIFPTGGSVYTSQGKFQVGPAVVAAYMTKKFILGVFPQQWWSYAGDPTRPGTSQMNLQPIASLFFDGGVTVGYSGNILADWKAGSGNQWTVPIGIGAGKLFKFGKLPVKVNLAAQYMVIQPEPVGQRWNIQIQFTPVLPKLIKGTLFE